jgi:hypothetical protein
MCSLNVHAGNERDKLLGRYFLPPRVIGAVYHDFSRNDLPEMLKDVDSQTRIYLLFMHDGAPTLFFCTSVNLEQPVAGQMDRKRWANSIA